MLQSAQNTNSEDKRLKSLYALELLNTPNEERFDRIIRLATKIFQVPIAGIALVDVDKVWFKSSIGLQEKEIPTNESIEEQVIKSDDIYIIPDVTTDPIFSKKKLPKGDEGIRFYGGLPLKSSDNERVGVFFVADHKKRDIGSIDTQILNDLGSLAQKEVNNSNSGSTNDNEAQKLEQELANLQREIEVIDLKNNITLNSIGDGVVLLNDRGEIVFANSQVEKLTGYSINDVKGKLFTHTLRLVDEKGNDVPVVERPIRNALFSRKRVMSNNYFYMRKDGSKFAASITATPMIIYDQIIGGVNVFRNITKEYEIDKMKTEFISLASHQLRTPLSAMKWFTEMLLDEEAGQLTEEQREIVQNVYDSNERMIDLVNTLLNISRIESGRIIIEPQPTDLKKLVDEVVTELQPKLQEKKHHLAVSVHGDLPQINVDPKLVRHVYMNLLTNAVKYTPPEGEIQVIISKSGNEIISQVSDSGFGIPKAEQEKVFSKFFRAKNIAKMETDGTGLGLYLTKAVVESSGGKIWFESEEGKGTTFWFILPLTGTPAKEGEVSLDS